MYLKKKEWINNNEIREFGVASGENAKVLLKGSEYEELLENKISSDSKLRIKGSDKLISEIVSFESELIKTDEILTLRDIEFIRVLDNSLDEEKCFGENPEYNAEDIEKENCINELELNLLQNNEIIKVESCYTVKSQYPELLELKSFYDACAKKDSKYKKQKDLSEKLMESFFETYSRNREILGATRNKYRIIKVENKAYLRTIVSEKYRDYNNLISVYIALYTLDKLARKNREIYAVEQFSIKDSEIKVTFSGVKTLTIKDVGEVSLDINLYNNELGKGALILNVTYCIKSNGKTIRFNTDSSIDKIQNKIFSINHGTNIDTVLSKIESGIKDTQKYENELLEIAEKIKNYKVTEQFLKKLLGEILEPKLKKLSENTKKQVKDIEQTLKTTKDVLVLFGKINDLKMEFGEREYMSFIFYKILKQWQFN